MNEDKAGKNEAIIYSVVEGDYEKIGLVPTVLRIRFVKNLSVKEKVSESNAVVSDMVKVHTHVVFFRMRLLEEGRVFYIKEDVYVGIAKVLVAEENFQEVLQKVSVTYILLLFIQVVNEKI